MGFLEEKERELLAGEIKMKQTAVKAAQISFEERLKGNFGKEMLEKIANPPKVSKWKMFLNKLKKVL